ncbi:MAG: sugar-binding transcriptional regulator [Pseudomonadota bacterium]
MLETRPDTDTDTDPQRALRIRAAWIYYVEGRTQNEVAQALDLNRVAVTRLLSEARARGEVSIAVQSDLAPVIDLARRLESRFGFERAVIAPWTDGDADPMKVIAAAAGQYISDTLTPGITVGVGWGRTLQASLAHLRGRPLPGMRVVSLLGGIVEAKRFNPAEFAWQFAERFEAEGFLVPAPALVDSPRTKHALLEHCGLDQVFQMAEASDLALLSCGGISSMTTSYRVGHLAEADRQSLIAAGAVGDVLYNFLDAEGRPIDHPVNGRAMAVGLARLRRIRSRVLISGGADKTAILRAAIRALEPSALVTDEQTARRLLEL